MVPAEESSLSIRQKISYPLPTHGKELMVPKCFPDFLKRLSNCYYPLVNQEFKQTSQMPLLCNPGYIWYNLFYRSLIMHP